VGSKYDVQGDKRMKINADVKLGSTVFFFKGMSYGLYSLMGQLSKANTPLNGSSSVRGSSEQNPQIRGQEYVLNSSDSFYMSAFLYHIMRCKHISELTGLHKKCPRSERNSSHE
jgi:hypothetical protein